MSAGYLWIDDVYVAEGDVGTRVATFTVRRVGGSDPFDVSFATSDGIARAADGDYVATSGVLHFNAGEAVRTISVTVNGDTKVELDEDFWLRLSNATNGALLAQDGATGLILSDDKGPAAGYVWIDKSSLAEGDSGKSLMTFTVRRLGGTAAFSVKYSTADYPGLSDYVPQSGVLQFAVGEISKTFTVEVIGDTLVEPIEAIYVNLSDPTSGAQISSNAYGLILDDDVGPAGYVSIADASVSEGNAGTKAMTFTITRTGGTAAFSIQYGSFGYSAESGVDFIGNSGTVQFGAGVTSQTISVIINGDTVGEDSEFFSMSLGNPTNGAQIVRGAAAGTIINDDAPGPDKFFWVDSVSTVEGDAGTTTMTFTVSRRDGSAAVSVGYRTVDQNASVADGDYLAKSGTLQFGIGVMSQTFSVTVKGDTKAESDEQFGVNLFNPTSNVAIAGASGTILNDDGLSGPARVWIDNASMLEGDSGTKLMTFTVRRRGGTGAFTVDYTTTDGSASVVEGDYQAAAGTLTFGAGVNSQTITVTVNGDTDVDTGGSPSYTGGFFNLFNEYFAVVLTNASNGAIVERPGFGLIIEDDFPGLVPIVAITNSSIVEGNDGTRALIFTVTRSGGSAAFSVNYATSDGSATVADNDYLAAAGTLQFGAGVNSQTISVTINGDTKPERTQDTFFVTLSAPTNGAILETAVATGVILNDEPSVLVNTGARLGALTAAQLAALPDQGIVRIDASDDKLVLNASQVVALDSVSLTLADKVTLADTGANLASLTTTQIAGLAGKGVDALDATDNKLALTVAQYKALGTVTLTAADQVGLVDTGGNLATLTVPEFSGLAAKGIDTIDATDNKLALTVAQYKALGAVKLTAADLVTLADTGENLATLTAADFLGLTGKGIDTIDATDNKLALTVAQYKALGTVKLTAADVVTLTDTGTNLATLAPTQVAGLAAAGIDAIDATTNTLALNIAQYKALGAVALTAADLVTLTDSSPKLAALTVAELAGLAGKNVDAINATDNKLYLTVAQYRALGAVTLTGADLVTLTDTGVNLATLTTAEIAGLAGKGIDAINATDNKLLLTVAQYKALGAVALTAADAMTLTDAGTSLATLTTAEITGLAGKGIDAIDATDNQLALTVAQYKALGTVKLTAADAVTLTDTGMNLATLTTAETATLASKGVDAIDATDNKLALNVAQYKGLGAVKLTAADAVTLTDTGTSLATLTTTQIAGLAGKGVDTIDATDNKLALTVAQYKLLGTAKLTAADIVTLTDTGTNLATLAAAELGGLTGKGIDSVDATTNTLALTVAQYKALGTATLTTADLVTLTDGAAKLAALTAAEFGGLAAKGVDVIDATDNKLALTVAQYKALGTVKLTAADAVTLTDTGINLATLTTTELAGLAGKGIDAIDATDNKLALTLAQFSALGGIAVPASEALTVTGASGNDTFTFANSVLGPDDRVIGEAGIDTLVLAGDYSAGLVFGAATISDIEKLTFNPGGTYNLKLHDGNVAAGGLLTVTAATLQASDSLIFDGSAESNGRFAFTGGSGSSTVTGGAKSDSFNGGSGKETLRYTAASQSSGSNYDTVTGFDASVDCFDLWTNVVAVGVPVTQGQLSGSSFDANLASAMAGLAAKNAVLFTASGGTLAGATFLVVDANGITGYQSGGDLVVRLNQSANLASLGMSSFV